MERRIGVPLLLVGALAGFALAACGETTTAPPTTEPPATTATTSPPTTEATTTEAAKTAVTVYFLQHGKVAAARRAVPETRAVAAAALSALAGGPLSGAEADAGLSSAVPEDAEFGDLRVEGGVARLTVPGDLSRTAQAQVVYTLTQFPTVKAVELAGREVTRADFEDETPQILVESPAPGETISSPVRVRGTANTFEATFVVELLLNAAGQKAFQQAVMATSGSGTRGTFDVTLPFDVTGGGPATLVAFEESADDGRPIHQVEIPVTIGG